MLNETAERSKHPELRTEKVMRAESGIQIVQDHVRALAGVQTNGLECTLQPCWKAMSSSLGLRVDKCLSDSPSLAGLWTILCMCPFFECVSRQQVPSLVVIIVVLVIIVVVLIIIIVVIVVVIVIVALVVIVVLALSSTP